MSNQRNHTLRIAASFKGMYSFLGMFLLIIAAIMVYVENNIFAIFLFVIGIQMFLNIKGILYNVKRNAIQVFSVYFGFRIGYWVAIEDIYSVEIRKRKDLLKEYTGSNTKTRYQVILILTKKDDIVVKTYSDKHKAVRFMKSTAELLGLEHNHLSK